MIDFGQFRLWPSSTLANSVSANFGMLNSVGPSKGPRRVEAQTQKKLGPEGWGPERWGKNFALFFSLSPQNSFFSSLSGGLLVEFWWCLKRRALKCARWEFSGCRVRAPVARSGGAGFTRQPKSPNVHISGFRPSKTPTKFHELWREKGKKRAKFWAVQRRGPSEMWGAGSGFRGSGFWGRKQKQQRKKKVKKSENKVQEKKKKEETEQTPSVQLQKNQFRPRPISTSVRRS